LASVAIALAPHCSRTTSHTITITRNSIASLPRRLRHPVQLPVSSPPPTTHWLCDGAVSALVVVPVRCSSTSVHTLFRVDLDLCTVNIVLCFSDHVDIIDEPGSQFELSRLFYFDSVLLSRSVIVRTFELFVICRTILVLFVLAILCLSDCPSFALSPSSTPIRPSLSLSLSLPKRPLFLRTQCWLLFAPLFRIHVVCFRSARRSLDGKPPTRTLDTHSLPLSLSLSLLVHLLLSSASRTTAVFVLPPTQSTHEPSHSSRLLRLRRRSR
jgi:hypothetical protein